MTGRHISIDDIYDADDPHRPNLHVARGREDCERGIRVVWNTGPRQEIKPFEDREWGSKLAKTRSYFAAMEEKKAAPGMPSIVARKINGLCANKVLMPDGSLSKTIVVEPGSPAANSQHTGAFILWKGFGKRKIRKSQRRRPAGWHGNHPAQKPIKVSRETLDEIPIWTPPAREQIRREMEEVDGHDFGCESERNAAIAVLEYENWEQVFETEVA